MNVFPYSDVSVKGDMLLLFLSVHHHRCVLSICVLSRQCCHKGRVAITKRTSCVACEGVIQCCGVCGVLSFYPGDGEFAGKWVIMFGPRRSWMKSLSEEKNIYAWKSTFMPDVVSSKELQSSIILPTFLIPASGLGFGIPRIWWLLLRPSWRGRIWVSLEYWVVQTGWI